MDYYELGKNILEAVVADTAKDILKNTWKKVTSWKKEKSDLASSPQTNETNLPTTNNLMLHARKLSMIIDSVRYPGFSGCSCKCGRCSQFRCGQQHRIIVLKEAINEFASQLPYVPYSNTLAQQYLANINNQAIELLLGIDKYASGIRTADVLDINYQIDELDAFQQRFKSSIIGLEACLA